MPLTLYVATGNPGKLRDFEAAALGRAVPIVFSPLPGLADVPAPPELGATFEENARGKAIAYSHHAAGCVVLADDSGLEVDALHGAPGVHSARYADDAGYAANPLLGLDARNNLLLLENLRGIAPELRTARYRCVLAAASDGQCIAVAEGTVEGTILEGPRGEGGFGYDPLFYLPELQQTMAEIGLQRKFQIGHRGHALRALLPLLDAYSFQTSK
ncbi:MAG: non-canonical purine NTP pyrophosphatase [Acidobacteriaceae bacterium]